MNGKMLTILFLVAFLSLMLFSGAGAQEPIGGPYQPDSATVMLLHFDGDLANSSAYSGDAVPNGNIGFISNAALGLGQCLWLDNDSPSDSSYLAVPDTAALDLTGSWTMEAWVNIITYGTSGGDWRWWPRFILKPGDDTFYYSNYFVAMIGSSRVFRTGYYTPSGANWVQMDSQNNLMIPGQWYHVTFIRDTSQQIIIQMVHDANMNLLFFGTEAYDPITGDPPQTSNQPVLIGSSVRGSDSWLDGFVDEIRISNVVRNFAIPPIITGTTQLGNQSSAAASYTIETQIRKIGSGDVQNAMLHYTTDPDYQTWNDVPLTSTGNGMYSADIPGQSYGSRINYYISAEDNSGQRATDPATAEIDSSYYTFAVWQPQSQTLALNFEEGQGIPQDTTTYANVVDTFGTPLYSTDAVEGSYSLHLTDSSYLEINSPFLSSEEFTIDLWFNADSIPQSNSRLIAKQGPTWYQVNYQIRFDVGGLIVPSSYIPSYGYNGDDLLDSTAYVTPGEWYRVIYAMSADSTYFQLRDAGDNIIAQKGIPNLGTPNITTQPFRVGHAGADAQPFFEGKVDAIKVYNYAVGSLTGIETPQANTLPDAYDLAQNYPNPFNPTTRINYSLPSLQHVTLSIYDVLGRKVRTLVDKKMTAGSHTVDWNGTNEMGHKVASGIYFYRLNADNFTRVRKMMLMR